LSAQLSVRGGELADKRSRPSSLGGVIIVACEGSVEGGCTDDDAVVGGGAFFGEGGEGSVSDVNGGVGS
jgi:hypothetical protein